MEVKEYLKPTNLEQAYNLLNNGQKCNVIGGGAWLKLTLKTADRLLSLENLGLDKISDFDDYLEIGSMVSLRDIEKNEAIKNLYDGILGQAISKIMGITVRNIATIGGSIMGRLAFSDIYPALLVMNTTLVFYKAGEISFQDFLNNPWKDKDILLKIKIEKERGNGFYKKVAKTPLDFAIANYAITYTNKTFRISIGATPYIAARALEAEAFLNQANSIGDSEISKAIEKVLDEIKFSNNIRASKEYRIELTKAYVKRGIKQVMKNDD